MKRPPGIWILLSAGVLWLSLQDVYGIRATSLIFGKTTTTTPGPVPNVTDGIDAEVVTEPSTESNGKNVSKPTLTGIPQLDYIHDPNLPKELNGYNLSEYPFYERVPDPEEIDFKCDGLHDGFYASITYKCQVYHHCLFGTRYDFLCANYTAFDQKTFICQFVSDVDCVGSKKFWHRNDALYKAATTTTLKPLSIYTTAPPENPALSEKGGGNQRAGGKRRRPLLRRPQYDYYDDYADYDEDYYEDRPRSNRRRRPRPRPRPIYDDEYDEEYEEDAYERRNRRPYNRRGSAGRRNKNRNKNREFEDYVDKQKERKKNTDEEDEETYSQNERKKPDREIDTEDSRSNGKKKPQRNDKNDERRRRPSDEDDSEKRKSNRDDFEEDSKRPSKNNRRPSIEDDYEDVPRHRDNKPRRGNEDEIETNNQDVKPLIVPTTGTIYDRPRVAPRIKPPVPKNEANKYAYKPVKATTPTIPDDEEYYDDYEEELPVKPSRGRKPQSDPITPKSSEIKEKKQSPFSSRNRIRATTGEGSSTNRIKTKLDVDSSSSNKKTSLDEEDDAVTLSPKKINRGKDRYRSRLNFNPTESVPEDDGELSEKLLKTSGNEKQNRNVADRAKIPDPEYYDSEYELEKSKEDINAMEAPKKKWRPSESPTPSTTPRISTRKAATKPTASTDFRRERPDQIVRIVKRPFLPSRGGNPYVARGLQPVGFRAATEEIGESRNTNEESKSKIFYANEQLEPSNTKSRYSPGNEPSGFEIRDNSKPNIDSSIRVESPRNFVKPKFAEPISEDDDDFKPIRRPSRPSYNGNTNGGPRTTQKPKVLDRNPLDISEQEYDVTLNDALNPTLPNLPPKNNFPTGFSPANDYTFSAFQRPRYVLEPILNSANSHYTYQSKQPTVRQQFETVPQPYDSRGEFLPNSNYYPQIVGGNVKGGIVQTQTQSYY